jgi:hypothetical protein
MITAPTLFAIQPPQPLPPDPEIERIADLLRTAHVEEWPDGPESVAQRHGFEYVQRDIVRSWVALDGGRRP